MWLAPCLINNICDNTTFVVWGGGGGSTNKQTLKHKFESPFHEVASCIKASFSYRRQKRLKHQNEHTDLLLLRGICSRMVVPSCAPVFCATIFSFGLCRLDVFVFVRFD